MRQNNLSEIEDMELGAIPELSESDMREMYNDIEKRRGTTPVDNIRVANKERADWIIESVEQAHLNRDEEMLKKVVGDF
ncbi:MAG: hypothetical protein ACRCZE_02600 [Candidatus Altimarinota bacterium]